jgi:hypothetical protein
VVNGDMFANSSLISAHEIDHSNDATLARWHKKKLSENSASNI